MFQLLCHALKQLRSWKFSVTLSRLISKFISLLTFLSRLKGPPQGPPADRTWKLTSEIRVDGAAMTLPDSLPGPLSVIDRNSLNMQPTTPPLPLTEISHSGRQSGHDDDSRSTHDRLGIRYSLTGNPYNTPSLRSGRSATGGHTGGLIAEPPSRVNTEIEEQYTLKLSPISPSELKRYDSWDARAEYENASNMVPSRWERYRRPFGLVPDPLIPSLTAYFPQHFQANPVPDGWKMLHHPEGSNFYYHESLRTFTDVNVCDDDIQGDVEFYANHFRSKLELLLLHHSNHLEEYQIDAIKNKSLLVLEPQLNSAEDDVDICYYFVNPEGQSLFWIHDVNSLLWGLEGVRDMSHKRLGIAAYYWKHCMMYPVACEINDNILDDAKSTMIFAKCNYTSTDTIGHLLNVHDIDTYLSVIDDIKVGATRQESRAVCAIGRIMHNITYNQFMNFHGTTNARLYDEDVYGWILGWDYYPSLWMELGSWFLFRAPKAYVSTLHDIYLNKIANRYTWREFITRLHMQLQDFNLLATVLLGANVGFLSIQSVDNGDNGQKSFTQIASYWSLTTSVGSIVLGTFLVRFHQSEGHKDVGAVASFLKKMHSHKRGLERLAVVYSLPYALLMWSLVFFSVAFITEAYQAGDRYDIISLAVVLGLTFCLVVYGTTSILYGSHNRGILSLLLR
ncbi:hypothetical protein CONPUDRAFT_145744 [Coniophora puteana RWD-64-598 SS2]|uniref:WW domain-containing protein n=1 Tax=Coniophora puteana (strain RWD-64-598) TaxID=741705 RepID=A0A5M3MH56_CONPW|nr:uncharacterized protein CONPUDRAFT_145744 [Coniophora puteana RWD-64-598 SS2]EIW78568.1 hypothetical protein CONPUDRAFT_145744 [Coniophora puteana RWD-64-598 SS2]